MPHTVRLPELALPPPLPPPPQAARTIMSSASGAIMVRNFCFLMPCLLSAHVPKVPESILFILLSSYLIKECMVGPIQGGSYLLKITKHATPITRYRSHSFRI